MAFWIISVTIITVISLLFFFINIIQITAVVISVAPFPNRLATGVETTTEQHTGLDFEQQVSALEQQLLRSALASTGNNQRAAAEKLGLSYNQVRGLMRKYGLRTRRARSAN